MNGNEPRAPQTLPLGVQIRSACILPPVRGREGCLKHSQGVGACKLTARSPTDVGNSRRCLQTHAARGGREGRKEGGQDVL